MGNRILSQGCFDSASFAYSIMNAYKCLIYPEADILDFYESIPKWKTMMKFHPQPARLIAGDLLNEIFKENTSITGTADMKKLLDKQLDQFMITSLNILSDKDQKLTVNRIKLSQMPKNDFSRSVIILRIDRPLTTVLGTTLVNHFICINGISDNSFNVVCPLTIHLMAHQDYSEFYNPRLKRYFNNKLIPRDLKTLASAKGSHLIYRISRLS